MARRSSRAPERDEDDFLDDGDHGTEIFTRQRLAAGGLTAFAVAFSYVTANAIWYQPHPHYSAFFETRANAGIAREAGAGETVIRIEQEDAERAPSAEDAPEAQARSEAAAPAQGPAPRPAPRTETAPEDMPALPAAAPPPSAADARSPDSDDKVAKVQKVLAKLDLYDGEVDGLTGPQTRSAVEAYRSRIGIEGSGEIDDELLRQLGLEVQRNQQVAAVAPPRETTTDSTITSSSAPAADDRVMRIQAGLKAFGNDGIELDGRIGPRTRSAITEFQTLFGLPVTGQPDAEVEAKMREIGLTN